MLDQFWSTIKPRIPDALVPHHSRTQIQSLTSVLPIEGQLAFECRLNTDDSRVDISQVFATDQIPLVLLIQSPGSISKNPYPFERLFNTWTTTEVANRNHFSRIWFEYDQTNIGSYNPDLASIFFEPRRRITPERKDHWADAMLEQAGVLECGETCSPHAAFSLIPENFDIQICGFMLSRQPVSFRVLAKAPSIADCVSFMQKQGLPYESKKLQFILKDLPRLTTDPIVALDFQDKLSTRVGIELTWPRQITSSVPIPLLDWLQKEQFCSEEKGSALEKFPVVISPSNNEVDWPDELVVDSLLATENKLSYIIGFVHHIKILIDEKGDPETKVYFGFHHLLLDAIP